MKKIPLVILGALAIPIILVFWVAFMAFAVLFMMIILGFWIWAWLLKKPIVVFEDGQRTGVLIREKFYPDMD